MPNFITKIFIAEFLSNFNVAELKRELKPGDLGYNKISNDESFFFSDNQ